ncbi:hypothetical protein ABPG74_010321 [Tetrahymena malaccensis]
MRVIRIIFHIFLIVILFNNKLTQGAYLKQNYISFDQQKCQQFDGTQGSTMGCTVQGFIASPNQSQTFLFVLYNPLSFSVIDTNLIVNSQCTVANKCSYAFNAPGLGKTFYNQKKSITKQTDGVQYEYIAGGDPFIQGTYVSDIIKFSSNDQSILMNFISVSTFGLASYIADGVISLSRGNSNNIFVEGYNQEKLISPKFMFGATFNSFRLNFNQEFNFENSPSIQTYSNDQWNVQIAGINFGDDDVLAVTHFQTFNVNTVQQIQVPYSLAIYIQNKYPKYFENNEYWQIRNCFQCSCLDDFPDITIYTSEYAFTFKMADLTYVNQQYCNMYISSSNFVFGLEQLISFGIVFNPLDGSLQFTQNVKTMNHLSISNFYPIMVLASTALLLLILILFKFELKLITIKDEFEFYKKLM